MTLEKITVKSVLILLGGVGALGAGVLTFNLFSHNQTGNTTINSNSSDNSNNSTNIDNSNSSTNINDTTNSNRAETTPSQLPSTTNQATIHIQTPKGGDLVERKIEMSGTLKAISDTERIWAYVYAPGEKRYYPTEAIYSSATKTWSVFLTIGSVNSADLGALFKIGTFTATTSLTNDLQRAGEKGMNELPNGIKLLKSITVKRK
jgi:hypothetical protein